MKTKEKIKTREALASMREVWKASGKTVGFTSGAFDLLHAGHVDYLQKAGELCDILIVGLNTDASIQQYKGPDRPIIPQDDRIQVIAALEMVDYVFLFEERRNKQNIDILKPDFYIKAGDYNANTLTSKDAVESYGGEVRLIPVENQISTSTIIRSIVEKEGGGFSQWITEEGAEHLQTTLPKSGPAVFLDRDGTINREILYLHEPERYELLPDAVEGVKKFQDMGYRIIVVTNQPGIGMGYYSKEDFYALNRIMLKAFSKSGILVDKIYFCPHSKSENCPCRKPGQAFVERAKSELNIDLSKSVMIGDKTSDLEFARRAGMKKILMDSGFQGKDGEFDVKPDHVVNSILEAANWILEQERNWIWYPVRVQEPWQGEKEEMNEFLFAF